MLQEALIASDSCCCELQHIFLRYSVSAEKEDVHDSTWMDAIQKFHDHDPFRHITPLRPVSVLTFSSPETHQHQENNRQEVEELHGSSAHV